MNYTTLISAAELSQLAGRPGLALVDCRFELADPDWGFEEYQQLHIPGAVYAHLDRELSAEKTPATGRHPLPRPADFEQVAARLGISNTSQVICYDTVGGAFAARLWWLLKYFGHDAAAVLDGGLSAWLKAGYPTREGVETAPPGQFTASVRAELAASLEEVDSIRTSPDRVLVDARTAERYRGEVEPIDRVAGHIPGAVNRFHQLNLNADMTMKAPEQLRDEFTALLKGLHPRQAVVYCGSGVTSCHHLLAMEHAGLTGARLYPGSYSEWITDPTRPVAKG